MHASSRVLVPGQSYHASSRVPGQSCHTGSRVPEQPCSNSDRDPEQSCTTTSSDLEQWPTRCTQDKKVEFLLDATSKSQGAVNQWPPPTQIASGKTMSDAGRAKTQHRPQRESNPWPDCSKRRYRPLDHGAIISTVSE